VRPHRHLRPPKAESFLVLTGHMVAFVFDDDGSALSGHLLGDGPFSGKILSRVANKAVARGIDLGAGLMALRCGAKSGCCVLRSEAWALGSGYGQGVCAVGARGGISGRRSISDGPPGLNWELKSSVDCRRLCHLYTCRECRIGDESLGKYGCGRLGAKPRSIPASAQAERTAACAPSPLPGLPSGSLDMPNGVLRSHSASDRRSDHGRGGRVRASGERAEGRRLKTPAPRGRASLADDDGTASAPRRALARRQSAAAAVGGSRPAKRGHRAPPASRGK